jgi:hypothetical protein
MIDGPHGFVKTFSEAALIMFCDYNFCFVLTVYFG